MKKINIQKDLDSRREISRMAYRPQSVRATEVEPIPQQNNDQSEEEIRQPADKIRTDTEKKGVRRRAPQGNP